MKALFNAMKFSPVIIGLCWLWANTDVAATLLIGGFGAGIVVGLWTGLRISKWRAA